MVIQAQAGQRLIGDAAQSRTAFRSIEASGREALVELRRLLAILRTADDQLAIGPQPGLGSLDSLIDQVREAGLPVEVRIEGQQVALPPGVDLSAYRIIQEAITNVLKHANASRVEVIVNYRPDAVAVTISDNGAGPGPQNGGSNGHGLAGMRERVALFGGDLSTGTSALGGFTVRATLPVKT